MAGVQIKVALEDLLAVADECASIVELIVIRPRASCVSSPQVQVESSHPMPMASLRK